MPLKIKVRSILLALWGMSLIGCTDIPADNPFDPRSAPIIQAPGQLSLLVVFPNQLSRDSLSDLDTIDLIKNDELRTDSEDPSSFQTRLLTEGAQLNPEGEGPLILQLQYSELPPGIYWLRPRVVGFVGGAGTRVEVSIAERALAELHLQNEPFGQVVGELHLEGREAGYYGGGLIRAEGRETQAISAESGRFSLPLGAGDHQLRFSAPGYIPRSLEELVEVKSGVESALATPIELSFEPATLRGTLRLLDAEGEAQPAQGLTISLQRTPTPGFLPQAFDVQSDDEGAFVAQQLIEGRWALHIQADGYHDIRESVRLIPGEALELPALYLAPLQRRIAGAASRLDQPSQGGVQISIRGEATIGGQVDLSVVSEAGNDRFQFPAIPAGQYELTYSVDGYAPQQTPLEITEVEEGSEGSIDLPPVILQPRRFQCDFPQISSRSEIDFSIEADDELSYVRVWYDSVTPPRDLVWQPRGDSLISLMLPEGVHQIFCQFATEDRVRDLESVYSFASEPLEGQTLVDLAAPLITLAALLPHPSLIPTADRIYLPLGDPFFIDIAAYDPLPGAGLEKIRLYLNEEDTIEIPFSSRFIGPPISAGLNQLEMTVVDAAENESERYQLPTLVGDEVAPESLQPTGPPLQTESSLSAERLVMLSFPLHDPEPSLEPAPIYFRLSEEGQVPGPWRPYEGAEVTFTLSEGPDGVRTILGEAKDAAGRILESNELLLTLDRTAMAPTGLSLLEGGRTLDLDQPLHLSGELLSLRVEALGADEDLRAELLPPHEGQCNISDARPYCTISRISGELPNNALVGQVIYQVKLVDEVGNQSTPATLTLDIDDLPPQNVYIDALSPELTNSPQVRIELDAFDATSYELRGDLDLVPETSATFPLEREINLSPGDGAKVVQVIFRDAVGNEATALLSFTLDQSPPSLSLELSQGGEAINSPHRTRDPEFQLTMTSPECLDAAIGDCGLSTRVSLSPIMSGLSFAPFETTSRPLRLPSISGVYQIYAEVEDAAGNRATAELGPVELDLTSPDPPTLRRDYISANKVRLELTPSTGEDLSYYRIERNIPSSEGSTWRTVALYPAVGDDLFRKKLSPELISCPLQSADCLGSEDCLTAVEEPIRVEDRILIVGQEHFYRAQAVDQLGNESDFSSPLSVGTPLAPPSVQISFIDGSSQLQWAIPEGTVSQSGLYRRFDRDRVELSSEEILLSDTGFTPPPNSGEAFSELLMRTQNRDESIIWETAISDYRRGQVGLGATIGIGIMARVSEAEEYVVIGHPFDSRSGFTPYGLAAVWLGEDSQQHRSLELEPEGSIIENIDSIILEGGRALVMSYDYFRHIRFSLLEPDGSSSELEEENLLILDEVLCEESCYNDNAYINGRMIKVGELAYFTYMHPTTKQLYDGVINPNTLELIEGPRLSSSLQNAGREQLLFNLSTGPTLFFSAEDQVLRSINLDTRVTTEILSLSEQNFELGRERLQHLAINLNQVELNRSGEEVGALFNGVYIAEDSAGDQKLRTFSMELDYIDNTATGALEPEPLDLSEITDLQTIRALHIFTDGSLSFINSRTTLEAGDTNTLYRYLPETGVEPLANLPRPFYDVIKGNGDLTFFFVTRNGELTQIKLRAASGDSDQVREVVTAVLGDDLFLKDLHRIGGQSDHSGSYVGHKNRVIYQYSEGETNVLFDHTASPGSALPLELEVNSEGSPLLFYQVEKDEIYLYDLENETLIEVPMAIRGSDTLESVDLNPPMTLNDGTALLSWFSCRNAGIISNCALSLSSYDSETGTLTELKTFRSIDIDTQEGPRLYEDFNVGQFDISTMHQFTLYHAGDEVLLMGNVRYDAMPYLVFDLSGQFRSLHSSEVTPAAKIFGVLADGPRLDILAEGRELFVHRYKGSSPEELFSITEGVGGILITADLVACEGGLVCIAFSTRRARDDDEQIQLFFSTITETGELTRTLLYEEVISSGDNDLYNESYNLQLYHKDDKIYVQISVNSNEVQEAGLFTRRIQLPYRPIIDQVRVDQLRPLGFNDDLDEDGLTDELDPCPLVAGEYCSCDDLSPPSESEATLLPDLGTSIIIEGSSDPLDPTWTRLDADCSLGEVETYYDQYLLHNGGPTEVTISVTANWNSDGYLHILRPPFISVGPHDCLAGNDDDDGDISKSHISNIVVPAEGEIIVLTSTYSALTAIGRYELTITSEP